MHLRVRAGPVAGPEPIADAEVCSSRHIRAKNRLHRCVPIGALGEAHTKMLQISAIGADDRPALKMIAAQYRQRDVNRWMIGQSHQLASRDRNNAGILKKRAGHHTADDGALAGDVMTQSTPVSATSAEPITGLFGDQHLRSQ